MVKQQKKLAEKGPMVKVLKQMVPMPE